MLIAFAEWGSCNFMRSWGEVHAFLQSAAIYWLKCYHWDGVAHAYTLPATYAEKDWALLMHTDWKKYGACTQEGDALEIPALQLPPFSGILLTCRPA